MSYRLDLARGGPAAVRAVGHEQLAGAIRQLTEERDAERAVHEARKHIKRLRSLLRLSRAGMDPAARRALNAELRDLARRLSAARDADVMVQTVGALRGRFHGALTARTVPTLEARFAAEAADISRPPDVAVALQALLAGVDEWPLDWIDFAAGATVVYARGRAEMDRALDDPSLFQLHEWRKRVKDLWYHAQLLTAAWPPVFDALAAEAHRLADRLGDDHDFGVLAERIGAAGDGPDVARLVALCHARREELQQDAFALGAKLYAESPRAFERRVRAYLA